MGEMQEHQPLFSVVIPAYKAEAFIARTLQSVYRQTEQDFEIIVVNDGSPDGTADVLARQADPRLRVITQENGGECVARNRGMAEARGVYLAFLDSDDAWRPDHLACAKRFFEQNPQYHWYTSLFDKVRDIREEDLVATPPDEEPFYAIAWFLEGDQVTRPSCVVARRSALPRADLFPPGIKMFGDSIGWCRMAKVHPMLGLLKRKTVLYRQWEGAATVAHFRAGGVAVEAFLLQQEEALAPDMPKEGRMFLRAMSLMSWWGRIRSVSLCRWRKELDLRRPLTGRWVTWWIKGGIAFHEVLILGMGKVVRMLHDRLQRKMAAQAEQVRICLPSAREDAS